MNNLKAKDFLAEPSDKGFREAVKQLILYEKTAFSNMNKKNLCEMYHVIEYMATAMECYAHVLHERSRLENKLRTYQENCRATCHD